MLTILAAIPLAGALAMMTLLQMNSRQVGLMTLTLVCTIVFVVPAFHLSPLQLLLSLFEGGSHLSHCPHRHLARFAPLPSATCHGGHAYLNTEHCTSHNRSGPAGLAARPWLESRGAMGVAVVLTASLTGLPVAQIGSLTALLSMPTTIVLSLFCLHLSGGKTAVRRWWWLALAAAAILTCGAWTLSNTVGVELVGILSSSFTLLFLGGVGAVVTRLNLHSQGASHKGSTGATNWDSLRSAALPYMLLTFFLLTAQVMQASSMTASLGASAASLGTSYVWISPWLAGLGAWLTGSNVGGTAMFAQLQKAAASSTGLSPLWLAAAQNGAGQLARMLSSACLMLAATSAGLQGQEGLIIRKFGPLVIWTIAFMMLLLSGIMTPSPLVICSLVVLLALPCLPTLRPFFLAMPARESGRDSRSLPRDTLRRVRGRTVILSRKSRAYSPGRRYKDGAQRTSSLKELKEPSFFK